MDRHLLSDPLLVAPWIVRRGAYLLRFLFPLALLLLLLAPWQQSALGTGRVTAWAPAGRVQSIDAPISGRLERWEVVEGQRVEQGQVLVRLIDNDPDYYARLEAQGEAAASALEATRLAVESLQANLVAEQARRELKMAEADAKVGEEQRKRVAEVVEVQTATMQLERVVELRAEGLYSQRELELTKLGLAKAEAVLNARDQTLRASRRARERVAEEGTAKVEATRAKLRELQGKLAEATAKLTVAESKLAKQGAQEVRAPREGTILRLVGGPGGGQVKAGALLVELVPTTTSRAVELMVDGNDIALIHRGDKVRLLFEGWPALQFVGLPGTSGGTYGGTVAFVDAAADGSGKFRALVLPDPDAADWPDPAILRRGVLTKGFFLLRQVPLGVELWRQVNGFPPMPTVRKGQHVTPPAQKKPRVPGALK